MQARNKFIAEGKVFGEQMLGVIDMEWVEEVTSLTHDLRGIHDNAPATATAFSEETKSRSLVKQVNYIELTTITIKDHTSDVNRFFATSRCSSSLPSCLPPASHQKEIA